MGEKRQRGLRILVVDDESIVRESLQEWLSEDGHSVITAADAKEALRRMRDGGLDLALVDIKMPGMDGLELQRRMLEIDAELTVIIMTAFASVETAVKALKEGAYDYITKPFDPDYLSHLLQKTAEQRNLVLENRSLKDQLAKVVQPTPILGGSPTVKRMIELIATVAPTDTTVLITGESGVGKELVARAIHASSPRAYMPLVIVNCGALPEGTLESELFGHERGAFTGALYRHKGKFELADGGTLFLDEIGEISAKIQVELLRVLEDKKVTRLGGSQSVRADFRVIVATNRNLKQAVESGVFREDLYYRLNVFHIDVPPLRERREDIPELAGAFVARLARGMNRPQPEISPAAMRLLMDYSWPGNIRELQNAIERALVVQKGRQILPGDLPVTSAEAMRSGDHREKRGSSLAEVERAHVKHVLQETDWNISETARILGVDRGTVYNKIKQHGLTRD